MLRSPAVKNGLSSTISHIILSMLDNMVARHRDDGGGSTSLHHKGHCYHFGFRSTLRRGGSLLRSFRILGHRLKSLFSLTCSSRNFDGWLRYQNYSAAIRVLVHGDFRCRQQQLRFRRLLNFQLSGPGLNLQLSHCGCSLHRTVAVR